MKRLLSAHVILLLFMVPSLQAWAQSGCVSCHADEALLKKLFSPPTPAPAEGEG